MKKLREMIRDDSTGSFGRVLPGVRAVATDEAMYNPMVDSNVFEERRAELIVRVEYRCEPLRWTREQARKDAERRLVLALYGPLLDMVYQLRTAARLGDLAAVHQLADMLVDEVDS